MKCDRIQQWILLEQSGELSLPRQFILHRHLATCAACRRWQADSRLLLDTPLPEATPSAAVIHQILAHIPSVIPRRSSQAFGFPPPVRRFALAVCAALVIIALGGIVWRQQTATSGTDQNRLAHTINEFSARCEELSALTVFLTGGTRMDKAMGTQGAATDAARETLAKQILILQEMDSESGEDADLFTLPAGEYPTTSPQAHNSLEDQPGKCV